MTRHSILLASALAMASCGSIQRERQLAEGITVGPAGRTLMASPVLKTTHRLNEVLIEVPDLAYPQVRACQEAGRIPVFSGSCVPFTVELVSERGERTPLEVHLALFNNFRYVSAWGPPIRPASEEHRFTGVRLQAGEPLYVARVIWMSYEPDAHDGAGFPGAAQR